MRGLVVLPALEVDGGEQQEDARVGGVLGVGLHYWKLTNSSE